MAKREDSKIRLLAVERMLRTDRYISATEIAERLEKRYDIRVDRKAIYSDLYAIDRIIPLEFKTGRNSGARILDFNWD